MFEIAPEIFNEGAFSRIIGCSMKHADYRSVAQNAALLHCRAGNSDGMFFRFKRKQYFSQ
jgi:hypothetical protein